MKCLYVFCICTLIGVNFQFQTVEEKKAFKQWRQEFGINYSSKLKEIECLKNFVINYNYILIHNKRFCQGLESFEMGLWEEADQSLNVTNSNLNSMKISIESRGISTPALVPRSFVENLNYVTGGYVNPVQNQLKCGSCWAFASCGAIEAQIFKKTGKLVELSTQQLVDCIRGWWWRSNGCKNGIVEEAFAYIKSYGVTTKAKYPYKANDTFPCAFDSSTSVTKIREHFWPQDISEEYLRRLLVNHGPLVIGMNAKLRTFLYYKSGVYKDESCDGTKLSHFVLLVGFGVDATHGKYWLIKNSYGVNWGESGYFRLEMGKNRCGILNYVAYAVL